LRQCDEAKASGERKVLKAAKAGEGELAGNHSANDDAFRPTPGTPWFTAIRSDDVIELILANPKAFILAFMIAFRARWKDGFNRHGLDKGEAMLGDWTAYGMTRQEYRTALDQLKEWGFATFRTTNKGTLAKLVDTRLFALLPPVRNQQDNQQATSEQPTGNHQTTTTGRLLRPGKTGNTDNMEGEQEFIPK
jgi:hypothetical protein